MQNGRAADGSQDRDHRGDDPTMSSETSSLINTSSQTPEVSESPLENGRSFAKTHEIRDGNLVWLSNSRTPESSSTSLSHDDLDPEQDHEITLTLHVSVYGREKHVNNLVAGTLRDLHVRGVHIVRADLNDKDVTEEYPDKNGRFFYDEKYGGYFPGIED